MPEANSKVTCRRLFSYLLTFYSVTFLGALLFIYIEECLPGNTEKEGHSKLEQYLKTATDSNQSDISYILNITKGFFEEPSGKKCVFTWEEISLWWDFTIVTLYTIGLGTITPETDLGKITLMIYAVLGIPITIAVYTLAASYMKQLCGRFICMVEHKLLKRNRCRITHFEQKKILLCWLILQIELTLATYITTIESRGSLNILDSYYFWFQCVSTIGYGDVYPDTKRSVFLFITSKIVSIFVIGMCATAITGTANAIAGMVSKREENEQSEGQNCQ